MISRLADLLITECGPTADAVAARQRRNGFSDTPEAAKGDWRDLARDTAHPR